MKYEIKQTDFFENWLNSKKVRSFKGRVLARFERIKKGNFGDHKPLSTDLFELRFTFGDGIRVYYTIVDNSVVITLAGGTKSTQSKDIKKANEMLEE
jgi:putative addiction module killer protein